MKAALALVVLLSLIATVALAEEKPATPATEKEKPAASQPAKTLDPKDTDALKAAQGQTVTVHGVVSRTGATKNGSILFINFKGVARSGFSAIARKEGQEALKDAFKADPAEYLPNRTVDITGEVSLYKDNPQIEVKTADQIKVSETAGSNDAKDKDKEKDKDAAKDAKKSEPER